MDMSFRKWLEAAVQYQPGQKVLAWGTVSEDEYGKLGWLPATVVDADQWEVNVQLDDGRKWSLLHGQVKPA